MINVAFIQYVCMYKEKYLYGMFGIYDICAMIGTYGICVYMCKICEECVYVWCP